MAEFTVTIRDIPGERRASVYFSNVNDMWPLSVRSAENSVAQHAFVLFNLKFLASLGLPVDIGDTDGK